MVTETAEQEKQETDPGQPEIQTEVVGELPEVAAEEEVVAAVESPALTQADFERMWSEKEADLRRQTIEEARELDRRQRQSEEGQRAAKARQQEQLRDAVSVSLVKKLGITELDDDTADDIISRVRGVETSAVEQSTEAAINEAITAAAAQVVGLRPDAISPEAQRYLGRFVSYMERLLNHDVVKDFISKDAKRAWEAELPKIVEAEISKRKPQAKPLQRVDGTPPLGSSDPVKLNQRIAYGKDSDGHAVTQADRDEFSKRYPG